MNALLKIVKEAKSLRRKFPHRYDNLTNPWRDGYMKQASAIYASGHRGRSPVGKKRTKKVGAVKMIEKGETKSVKPKRIVQVSRSASGRFKKFKTVGSVKTLSRTHTDKNRITANIQVGKIGTLQHHVSQAKKLLADKIGYEEKRKFLASTKRAKNKIADRIADLKAQYRKLV